MAERIILHCDLNNFFASVSLLYNPTLIDMPVAVCGDTEQRHGIVLAKLVEGLLQRQARLVGVFCVGIMVGVVVALQKYCG